MRIMDYLINHDAWKYLPTRDDIIDNFNRPTLVLLEILFLFLTLAQVFIIHRVLQDVAPFPVFLTFTQMVYSLSMSTILGEFGQVYKKFKYFPRTVIDFDMFTTMIVPSIFFTAMMLFTNIIMQKIGSVSGYPIVSTAAVIVHHCGRFLVCGENYLLLRWQSIGLLFVAFLIGTMDSSIVGLNVIPYAFGFALVSTIYRGGYFQRLLHQAQGNGNYLQTQHYIIGSILLLPLVVIMKESNFVFVLPFNITKCKTWLTWGCIFLCALLPFAKNVVANRIIKSTGQGPWRCLEIISIALIFIVGNIVCRQTAGLLGWIGISIAICGRSLCALDVKRNADKVDELFDIPQDGDANSSTMYSKVEN